MYQRELISLTLVKVFIILVVSPFILAQPIAV
jgi:hypothetical protein